MSERDNPENWQKLVQLIYTEKDIAKLPDLIRRLSQALDKEQASVKLWTGNKRTKNSRVESPSSIQEHDSS